MEKISRPRPEEVKVERGKGICDSTGSFHDNGLCAICLDKIELQDMAIVKGCEHAYCVTCILHWAAYNKKFSCPQCKHPFEILNVHRSVDGSICDYMFEESVCLLLRANWFVPLQINTQRLELQNDGYDELEYFNQNEYDDEIDNLDDNYFGGTSSIRIGNRRWGDNGFVRAGRKEARPINRQFLHDSNAGTSQERKKKEASKDIAGRRAKRAMKREAADKAAAAKHQQYLKRLGQE